MSKRGTGRGTSPAALAWLGALALLLAGSLALIVYAGRAKWRELASERPAPPAATRASASSEAGARGARPAAQGSPAKAQAAKPATATRPRAGRDATRPGPEAAPAARPKAEPRRTTAVPSPAEAGPGSRPPSTRPRVEPKRLPREEAARRLEAMGAKLDRDHFQFAVARGEIEQVRVFLEAGYSPNLKMENADYSIFYLTLIGLPDAKQEAVATLMLDYGADLEVRAPSGITPLMMAAIHCRPGFATALIDRGAQMNATDPEGTTALVWAQRASCAPVAALLKKRGAR